MSLLMNKFTEEVKKSKDPSLSLEAGTRVGYETGFSILDYMNGVSIKVHNDEGEVIDRYNSVGVANGSINMLYGVPGCGKTTAAIQMAGHIVRPFTNGMVIHEELEADGSNLDRTQSLLGWTYKQMISKYSKRDAGINSDNFYERVKIHHDAKMELGDLIKYNTGYKDRRGNDIIIFEPSVVILDSLPLLMPKANAEEDQLSGPMAAQAQIRINGQVFKRLSQLCKAANIIILIINHQGESMSIGPVRPKKMINTLKGNETIPGGRFIQYICTNIWRFEPAGNIEPDEGYKLSGFVSDVAMIKSRNNNSAQIARLVLDRAIGFDPILSLLEDCKSDGVIKSAAWMTIPGTDHKFQNSTFKAKFENDPEFARAFLDFCKPRLNSFIREEAPSMTMGEFDKYMDSLGFKFDNADMNSTEMEKMQTA